VSEDISKDLKPKPKLKYEDFLVGQSNNDLEITSDKPAIDDKQNKIYNLNILAYVNVCLNSRNNLVSSRYKDSTKQKCAFFIIFFINKF
jgi:hypothetical protein